LISTESVKAKLKKVAGGRDFDYVLMRYFTERLLYRLSVSPYSDNFILKGGLLLYVTLGNSARATRDIDFLARRLTNTPEELSKIFVKIAKIPFDAVVFDTETLTVERIKEDAEYEGLRIKLIAHLDRSRHVLQFDIGFGDVILPHPVDMTYPSLLDMEPPRLKAYSLESVIAEKFQAIIYLAKTNSRMKDFYDIYELSRSFDFDGSTLCEAISKTFEHRAMILSPLPVVFTDDFPLLKDKQTQWRAFQRRIDVANETSFPQAISTIKKFLSPVYDALFRKESFTGKWCGNAGVWQLSHKSKTKTVLHFSD
jgi:predicted nucleotidyltransferase component of viral defense system